jgi:hypothetical protein
MVWTTHAAGHTKSRVVNPDVTWRVTEAGKSRLLGEQQKQQIQESSNEVSQTIGTDIPNGAAQAEFLRAEQLSLQHNSQLAFYAQAKAQQIDNLQKATGGK